MTRVAAVVLAAGAATRFVARFGVPKQRFLIWGVLDRVAASPVDEIVVVEGAHEIRGTMTRAQFRLVTCPDWQRGPGASLRCGLESLGEDVDAAVVVLADGPWLAPSAITRVIESWRAEGGDVVAASYGGIRGHPLLVARRLWHDIPDDGLRVVEPRLVPCDDLSAPGDVDTPDDLATLE